MPRVHLPSVLGRARADRGPLLLAALVLALGALLACGIPAAVARAADDAMHAAVTDAGDSAALVATVPFPPAQDNAASQREPASAALTDAAFRNTRLALPSALAGVVRTPIARVTTDPLEVAGHGAGRSLVLAYVTAQTGDPRVVWTSGRAPAASAPSKAHDLVRSRGSAPWQVEVGLSEAAAAALGVRAGDRIGALDERHEQLNLLVSGVYRVGDARDPVWAAVPHLLAPASFRDDAGHGYLAATALLSRDSLPDARIAIDEDLVTREVVYRADPGRIGTDNADAVVEGIVRLQAASSDVLADDARWATNLDAVVRAGQRQVAAAQGQAGAVLAGLVTVTALVTALAADLLVRRRALALGLARVRGASLPGLGLELAVESVAVVVVGTVAGALVALALGGRAGGGWLAAAGRRRRPRRAARRHARGLGRGGRRAPSAGEPRGAGRARAGPARTGGRPRGRGRSPRRRRVRGPAPARIRRAGPPRGGRARPGGGGGGAAAPAGPAGRGSGRAEPGRALPSGVAARGGRPHRRRIRARAAVRRRRGVDGAAGPGGGHRRDRGRRPGRGGVVECGR